MGTGSTFSGPAEALQSFFFFKSSLVYRRTGAAEEIIFNLRGLLPGSLTKVKMIGSVMNIQETETNAMEPFRENTKNSKHCPTLPAVQLAFYSICAVGLNSARCLGRESSSRRRILSGLGSSLLYGCT